MRILVLLLFLLSYLSLNAAGNITCQKNYPYHLQGVATDGTHIYWSFSDYLVKTDLNGAVVAETKTVMHSGDLCVTGGKVYVATEEGLFVRESGFNEEIRIYDSGTLDLERTVAVPDLVNGCSAMTYANGKFFVASGIPQDKKNVITYNEIFEYDSSFKLLKTHRLNTGYTEYGIQTIHYARDRFYIGFYGSSSVPTGTFVTPSDLSSFRRYDGDTSVGILELDNVLYRAMTGKQADGAWNGVLTEYPDPVGRSPLMTSPVPGIAEISASSALTGLGFLPSSYLLAGGTVSELLSGAMNLQVNNGSSGGGVVTLANAANTFSGGIHIANGTLTVPSTRAVGRLPSALGSGVAPIVLGPGTLRFSGDFETDRNLVFLPSPDRPKGASIVRVDDGATATFRSRITMADGAAGNFMKTGSGTLVVATPYSDGENKIGAKGAQPGWVGVNTPPPSFASNGDGPVSGFEACNIVDGRLEIATGPSVVTRLPTEVWVGMNSTAAADAETAGHIDIRSGIVIFDSALVVGRHNGTATTAPAGLSSSFNMYGGEVTVSGILNLGYGSDSKFTHRPEVNIHGGTLKVNGNVRLDHNWSYGKIVVDGGQMTAENNVYNQYYMYNETASASGGSQLYLDISGSGVFTCKGSFYGAHYSCPARPTVCRIDVRDGGVFASRQICSESSKSAAGGNFEIHVDGGTFKSLQSGYGDVVSCSAFYVGPEGMTLNVEEAKNWGPRWLAPIRPEPGKTDGGIDIVGKYSADPVWHACRVRLETDDISITGGFRVKNAGVALADGEFKTSLSFGPDCLVHTYGDATVDSLSFDADRAFMNFGYRGIGTAVTNMPKLTALEFTPPSGPVRVACYNGDGTTLTYIPGTYDIFAFPADVAYGAKDFVVPAGVASANFSYRFSERTESSMRIISLTVSSAGAETPSGLDPRETDAWQTGTDPWFIGPWLYVHGGNSLATAAPLTLALPANRLAGILVPQGVTLTLKGGISSTSGGFAKMGDGSLMLSGDAAYSFGTRFECVKGLGTDLNGLQLFDGTGNGAPSLTTHGANVTVGRGTLALGTGTDSPLMNITARTFDIGTATTDAPDAEGDASFILNSGELRLDSTLNVGLNHGTAETRVSDCLVSSYTQNGGVADVLRAAVGVDNSLAAKMESRFTLNGGVFNCRNAFLLGHLSARSELPMKVVFRQTGGSFSVGGHIRDIHAGAAATSTTEEGRFLLNYGVSKKVTVEYTMTGGEAFFHRGFQAWNEGDKTINLSGGVIHFREKFGGGSGTVVNWNGTVLVPHVNWQNKAPTVLGVFTAVNTESEAIIDVSHCREVDMLQAPSGSGRIVVRGATTNNVLRLPALAYDLGGVTVEKGAMVIPLGNSGKSTAPADILVRDGGGICDYYGNAIPSLTLGEKASDTVVLCGYDMRRNLTYLKADALAINAGKVYVGYRDPLTGEISLYGGSQKFLRGPKGTIDAAKFALHPVLAARGAKAEFRVEAVADDDGLEVLVADVSNAGVSVWTADASGEWMQEDNWNVPPSGSSHDIVEFPETLSGDITVNPGGAHVWTLTHRSANTVRIGGDIAFDGCAEYNIMKPDGVLEISGTASTATGDANSKTLVSRGTSGRGTLRVTGKLAPGLKLESRSGRIEGRPEAFGSAPITLNNATLRFTESGICRSPLAGTGNGACIEVPAKKTVYMTGVPDVQTPFAKVGPGTVVFRASGHVGSGYKNVNGAPWTSGSNGDLPCAAGFSLYSGTLVFDGANASFTTSPNANNYGMAVGFRNVPDGTGGAYPAVMEITGGAQVDSGGAGLHIGCYANNSSTVAYDGPVKLALTRRPYKAVNIRNGRLSVASLLLNYNNYSYQGCMVAELNVWDGGEFVVKSGRFAVCHDGDDVQLAEGPSVGVVNLHGGLIDHQGNENVVVNYYSSNRKYHARGIINLFGGLFRTKPEYGFDLMRGIGHGSLNLCGGVLETGFIKNTKGNNKALGDVHFDGGTFRPLQSGKEMKGWDTFTVGPGGATFDLSRANALTLAQTLAATNGTAGGITLDAGDNAAAVLALKVENAFGGPITVNGGRIFAEVPSAASCATGVVVNAGGVFDANTFNLTFHSLKGEGGVYSNGVVTVTGSVAPVNTTFTVEDLVFGDGAVLSCPVEGDAENGWTAPYLTVTKSVSKAGSSAVVDLGREPDSPLPKFAAVKVAEVAPGAVFPQMQVINAGGAGTVTALSRRLRGDGVTEVWAQVNPSATVIMIR